MLAQAKPTLKRESLKRIFDGRMAIQSKHWALYAGPIPFLRNALTPMLRFGYAPPHDYKNLRFHFCNRTCERLRRASSVSYPGRIACPNRRIACNFRVACRFTQSEARQQKKGGCHSSESRRISVAC